MAKQTIGKYVVTGTLGRGSMGVVYKAMDPEIGRTVAVKTLRKLSGGDDPRSVGALERFRTEARSAGNLRHPNLITVFEVNIEGEIPYIVMDYVNGISLDGVLAKLSRLYPDVALFYLKQVASGIDAAHRAGVIHRDLKPSNLIVDRNEFVFVVDFGVASINAGITDVQRGGKKEPVMGTPAYMSPEQILNKSLGPRSDLFSLAVVAFEFFSGSRPFSGRNFTEVLNSILSGNPTSLTSLVDLPIALEAEFERALAKDPDKRFGSAEEMVQAFAKALRIERIERPAIGTDNEPERGPAKKRRTSEWRKIFTPGTGSNSIAGQNVAVPVMPEAQRQEPAKQMGAPAAAPLGGKPVSPGHMFRNAAQIRTIAPSLQRTGLIRRGSELAAGLLLIVFLAAAGVLVFMRVFGDKPEQTVPVQASNQIPDPSAIIDREESLRLPDTDRAPDGLMVAEMSDRQVLGVLVDDNSAAAEIVSALDEAARRKIPGVIPACAITLQNPSHLVRIRTLEALAATRDPAAVQIVVIGLDDHDPMVRRSAAKAAGELGSSLAIGYLTMRHSREDVPLVKTEIVKAMEIIKGYPLPELRKE